MNASQILQREYLEIRAKILELAASLDRIDRADGNVDDTEEMNRLRAGIDILVGNQAARAERVQMLFSQEYTPKWQSQFDLTPRV